MGRHSAPDGQPPGPDKLYPRHSEEDMRGDTGTLTSVDLQRVAGILPRDTPPGGNPIAPPPHRRARPRYYSTPDEGGPASYSLDDEFEAGRSVDPPLSSRVISAILVIAVLVILILVLGGKLWV